VVKAPSVLAMMDCFTAKSMRQETKPATLWLIREGGDR